ncbi:MAG: HAD family phosphatase [Chloroflexi bacterium]|nr:HAD family phosphatase [Chloroflexota bacterium]
MADTEPLHRRAFNIVLAACGASYEYGLDEYGRTITGRAIFENAERLRERFGLAQNAQEIADGHRAMFNLLIADAENIQAMPGLTELLAYLAAQNIRTAIASSSRPEQIHTIVRGLNLHHTFQAIVGNDGTLKPKPAPDVYLRTLAQLGASPKETLALEDSSSGVRAAKAAGLTVIAVPNDYTKMQDFSAADLLLRDLRQVREHLEIAYRETSNVKREM